MIHNRRVAAVICLHHGACYLPYAMRSVSDIVDDYVVCYSPFPNHGHFDRSERCPDTREMLMHAAYETFDYPRVRWIEHDSWRSEGEQFMAGWGYTNADVIVKLDADELWPPGLLADAITHGIAQDAREVRVPLVHLWRSFHKGFTNDPAAPGRIHFHHVPRENGETTYTPSDVMGRIFHFGYALPVELMRYKVKTHGHKSEFIDPNWIDTVYAANRQSDCHPCGHEYWRVVQDITPPAFLMDHPFAHLDLIE